MEKKEHTKLNIRSVRGRMFLLTAGTILGTIIILSAVILPAVKKSMVELTTNNLMDLAIAYGSDLEGAMNTKKASGEQIRVQEIGNHVEKAYIKGCDTSYCYVVSSEDGTMMYHPKEELVGTKCENSLVEGLVKRIKDFEAPQPEIVQYNEEGVAKYAAYYYSIANNYILIVCVNEKDFLGAVNGIVGRGVTAGIIVYILGQVVAFIAARKTTKPLNEIVGVVDRIATLDLTMNPKLDKLAHHKDETGQLARAVKKMRLSLADIVSQVKEQSVQLYNASDGLNDSVELSLIHI